jgi:hypothetical protein
MLVSVYLGMGISPVSLKEIWHLAVCTAMLGNPFIALVTYWENTSDPAGDRSSCQPDATGDLMIDQITRRGPKDDISLAE